jgi:hypothetical protein
MELNIPALVHVLLLKLVVVVTPCKHPVIQNVMNRKF